MSNRTEKVISFSIIKWNKTLCPIPLQTKIWHWLPALFEPDKDQIPQIMERIFLQYYKLYEGADIFLDYLSDQSKSMSVLYRTQIS